MDAPQNNSITKRRAIPAWAITNFMLAATTVYCWGYYAAPIGGRMRHDMHLWLKPSGYLGQSAGILTFLGFLFMWLYPLRKANPNFAWPGSMGRFLEVHIAVGLTLPILGAVHASWRFTGIIGIGYWAMFIVILSGIIGRYIYAHIPRSRAGLAMSLEEASGERRSKMMELASITGLELQAVQSVLASEPLPRQQLGFGATLKHMLLDDLARRKAARQLLSDWQKLKGNDDKPDKAVLKKVRHLARREMSLAQQERMLDATQRLFQLWHVAHRPAAIIAVIAVTIHVVVVVAFGATWFH